MNVPFERGRAVEYVDRMIASYLGLSADTAGRLTDFNAGSNIRNVLDAIALRLEALDTKMFTALRRAIPMILFEFFGEGDGGVTTSVGFPRLPALSASGPATFTRDLAVTGNVTVPAATKLHVPGLSPPQLYSTMADLVIPDGVPTGTIMIQASAAGTRGDASAGSLVLLDAVTGILSATNDAAMRGRAEESDEDRRLRFAGYIRNLARCQEAGLEVGALTVALLTSGQVTERVLSARATARAEKRGIVDLHVDNGGGGASAALVAEVQRVIDGARGVSGERIPGYKAAGVVVVVASVTARIIPVTLTLRVDATARFAGVATDVQAAIEEYVLGLGAGTELIWADLLCVVASIAGVADVAFSTPTANVEVVPGERLLPGTVTITEDALL